MKIIKEKSNRSKKGFTLVEVLVAILLLFIVISASTALVTKALSSTQSTKSKFIASYLAQEGLELVRNIRDSNWVESQTDPAIPWDEELSAGDWEIDYQSQNMFSYSDRKLNINSSGFYNYNSGTQTAFTRKISIQKIDDAGNEYHLRVTSQVGWSLRGINYNLLAIEDLYNWYGTSSE
jgi:prepilin-type N-terminal cleavage/methylation domain-containing protein